LKPCFSIPFSWDQQRRHSRESFIIVFIFLNKPYPQCRDKSKTIRKQASKSGKLWWRQWFEKADFVLQETTFAETKVLLLFLLSFNCQKLPFHVNS
jgi:hypothetical protein